MLRRFSLFFTAAIVLILFASCASAPVTGKAECTGDDCGTPTLVPCSDFLDCPNGEACIDGYCDIDIAPVPEDDCTTDGDCDEGMVCNDGACIEDGGSVECGSDSDCTGGRVCTEGSCSDKIDTGCKSDADCKGGFVCEAGSCAARSEPEDHLTVKGGLDLSFTCWDDETQPRLLAYTKDSKDCTWEISSAPALPENITTEEKGNEIWIKIEPKSTDCVAEKYDIEVTACDKASTNVCGSLNKDVETKLNKLTDLTASLSKGAYDTQYGPVTLEVSGGSGAYKWEVSEGALPEGLSISGGNEISGTPKEAGSFSVKLKVTDDNTKQEAETEGLEIVIDEEFAFSIYRCCDTPTTMDDSPAKPRKRNLQDNGDWIIPYGQKLFLSIGGVSSTYTAEIKTNDPTGIVFGNSNEVKLETKPSDEQEIILKYPSGLENGNEVTVKDVSFEASNAMGKPRSINAKSIKFEADPCSIEPELEIVKIENDSTKETTLATETGEDGSITVINSTEVESGAVTRIDAVPQGGLDYKFKVKNVEGHFKWDFYYMATRADLELKLEEKEEGLVYHYNTRTALAGSSGSGPLSGSWESDLLVKDPSIEKRWTGGGEACSSTTECTLHNSFVYYLQKHNKFYGNKFIGVNDGDLIDFDEKTESPVLNDNLVVVLENQECGSTRTKLVRFPVEVPSPDEELYTKKTNAHANVFVGGGGNFNEEILIGGNDKCMSGGYYHAQSYGEMYQIGLYPVGDKCINKKLVEFKAIHNIVDDISGTNCGTSGNGLTVSPKEVVFYGKYWMVWYKIDGLSTCAEHSEENDEYGLLGAINWAPFDPKCGRNSWDYCMLKPKGQIGD